MSEQQNIHPKPATKDAVAVALSQRGNTGRAPKVVAGGRGRTAEQIVELAFANGVQVREDADLAGVLSAIDPENEIPPEAFAAVAEILVYLYHVNGYDDLAGLSRDDLIKRWMEPAPS